MGPELASEPQERARFCTPSWLAKFDFLQCRCLLKLKTPVWTSTLLDIYQHLLRSHLVLVEGGSRLSLVLDLPECFLCCPTTPGNPKQQDLHLRPGLPKPKSSQPQVQKLETQRAGNGAMNDTGLGSDEPGV